MRFLSQNLVAGGDVNGSTLIAFRRLSSPQRHQKFVALELQQILLLFSSGSGQACLFRSLIQNHEQLAWLYLITLSDLQLKDPSGRLSRQLHQITGFEGAHRVDIVGEHCFFDRRLLHLRQGSLSTTHPASRQHDGGQGQGN